MFKHITGEMYVLLSTPAGALIGVIVADAWQWTPFVMLLVLAGLVVISSTFMKLLKLIE